MTIDLTISGKKHIIISKTPTSNLFNDCAMDQCNPNKRK